MNMDDIKRMIHGEPKRTSLNMDLRKFIKTEGDKRMIYHPFLGIGEYNKESNEHYNNTYSEGMELANLYKVSLWDCYLKIHNWHYYPNILLEIQQHVKEKGNFHKDEMAELIQFAFTKSDQIWFNIHLWKKVFKPYINNRDLMNEEEKACFDNLPESVVVYRKTDPNYIDGMSWTLCPEVAERHKPTSGIRNKVYIGKIKKCDVITYWNRAEAEKEIVTLLNKVKIISEL